ncbi:hypothetical protein FisN_24Lh169 [Fistulifera solaris]|uniref:Oxidoreductase n=1 Tax=Fistulifera solaris TaxID=1519565 RepID=A0A1Z5K9P5_FISSO|nr:hypothetical protein FisN_24Lh169 [Fistulifera solaris]|eukprot:GAX22882.1 hypothetical protein FisN_24Lh169 [Fistulifera solaris]
MPPNQRDFHVLSSHIDDEDSSTRRYRCAVLGCGMMGQEHVSYMAGYADRVSIDFLCDPHTDSLNKCVKVLREFSSTVKTPMLLQDEEELLQFAHSIDLLVIATPNYQHAGQLLRWANNDMTILVEKPAAISTAQIDALNVHMNARVWVAMEYRFMPAIRQLLELRDVVGDIQMVTIRENRFPFLHKIGAWNRDPQKTGDTLVEKCCHFFDLMRLITGQEVDLDKIRTMAQRGINYEHEALTTDPIIDAAYVMMKFRKGSEERVAAMGCLELCMYADGSRHQEEIVVTGTKGRLEAYLPENKVYAFVRPNQDQWKDRSVPPPRNVVQPTVFDCNKMMDGQDIPSHGGYHYGSTAVEWYRLLNAMDSYKVTGEWEPAVSLTDGIRAVEIGLTATAEIVNDL